MIEFDDIKLQLTPCKKGIMKVDLNKRINRIYRVKQYAVNRMTLDENNLRYEDSETKVYSIEKLNAIIVIMEELTIAIVLGGDL